ncbi:MAG: carboxypeptidase M32 [Christensenellaceae bacterium]|nr:carboxypeptidase M32 [Christensenellaceae bacterium]
MEFQKALELFKKNNETMGAYGHAMGVMYYDMDTVAPKNAFKGFGKTIGILSEIQYRLSVNDENFEIIDTLMAHKDELDFITRREVEEAAHDLDMMRKIPIEEYTAYRVLLTEAREKWLEAKATNNYELFEPVLAQIVDYNRRIAGYIDPSVSPYDFWLNEFERGASVKMLDEYFAKVKDALVPLIHSIKEKGDVIDTSFAELSYPLEGQRKFSDYLMKVLTINKDDCSIGETEHPFTTHFNKHDVRITTHYHDSVTNNMYSVIHEGGHALYELNTGDDIIGSPLASGASTGIHESQSRLYENIIGRSEEFIELIFPKLKELFPEQLKDVSAHMFYLAVNKAQPSLIRIEADELTYSMHVLIRYELEKRLMDGSLSTKELPAEWNRLYKEYLGVDVPDDTHGCLQDSHWSSGTLGYFPSYSLGSAYGAQIVAHMKKELDIAALVKENKIGVIVEWLTEKIYKYGMLLRPDELIKNCCGEEFNPQYYVDYLTEKFKKIYNL